jgi:hypothetical protein
VVVDDFAGGPGSLARQPGSPVRCPFAGGRWWVRDVVVISETTALTAGVLGSAGYASFNGSGRRPYDVSGISTERRRGHWRSIWTTGFGWTLQTALIPKSTSERLPTSASHWPPVTDFNLYNSPDTVGRLRYAFSARADVWRLIRPTSERSA